MNNLQLIIGGFLNWMRMEKVAVEISNFKFDDVPSENTIFAQRQQQHAAEQGEASLNLLMLKLNNQLSILN